MRTIATLFLAAVVGLFTSSCTASEPPTEAATAAGYVAGTAPTTEWIRLPPSEHDLRPFVFPGDIDPDNPGWRKITIYPKYMDDFHSNYRNDIDISDKPFEIDISIPSNWIYRRDFPEHVGNFYEGDLTRMTGLYILYWVSPDFSLDGDTCNKIKEDTYFGPLHITPSTTDDPKEGETVRGYKYLQYSKRSEGDWYYKPAYTYNCFVKLSDKYVVLFHTFIDEDNSDTGVPTDEIQSKILDSLNFVDSSGALVDS